MNLQSKRALFYNFSMFWVHTQADASDVSVQEDHTLTDECIT